MMLLKLLYLTVRVVLALACALWALILVELLPVYITGGMSGVRAKLMQIWGITGVDLPWTCYDSLQIVHEGYTDLLFFAFLTWAILELKRFLSRRITANAEVKPETREHLPEFL